MEQDNFPSSEPNPGMYGSDREVFQRVWRRVMPEEREDCPIELHTENAMSPSTTAMPANTLALPAADKREENLPRKNDVPCLGAGSAVYGGLLQKFISDELTDWKFYQTLARWAGACASDVLSGIAADEHRHAKRLSTAYFLISGVCFWPKRLPTPVIQSYLGALRQRFVGEQQGEAVYLAAAAETTDQCLHELYLELAGDEAAHSRLIRSIIEQTPI